MIEHYMKIHEALYLHLVEDTFIVDNKRSGTFFIAYKYFIASRWATFYQLGGVKLKIGQGRERRGIFVNST